MSSRQYVTTGAPWEDAAGYARAVRVGNVIEVSGTTAMSGGAQDIPPSAADQARIALAIIEKAIRELGGTLSDVVRIRLYVVDAGDAPMILPVLKAALRDVRPAATLVEVGALIDPRLQVEIEATAIIG